MNQSKRQVIKELIMILVIALAYAAVMGFSGIGCPIKWVTGISCPGCGMTRAWFSLFYGDLADAFHCHPLFWTIPVMVVLFLARRKFTPRTGWILIGVIAALYLGVYAWRLASGDYAGIVDAQPAQGAIGRVFDF